MTIEVKPVEGQPSPGVKKFNAEFEKAIKRLMKLGVHPTADNIFSYLKTHPGDCPFITSRMMVGLEPHLRVYLELWGVVRGSVPRKLTPEEAERMDGTNMGLPRKPLVEVFGG